MSSVGHLSDNKLVKNKPKTRFIVCIPALNEQRVIQKTLDKFVNQNYPKDLLSVYVVTSERESTYANNLTTNQVIHRYKSKLNTSDQARLNVLHYPDKEGLMVHQINFVARKLETELRKPNVYFVIYNADSEILPNTFEQANDQIKKLAMDLGEYPKILQQSALYQYYDGSGFFNKVAEGAGLHQSLWTLMHEIPRYFRQNNGIKKLGLSFNYLKILKNSRITHCVCHGLFIRGKYYIKHPLPNEVLNEDIPYGLLASVNRIPVYSLNTIELASTPKNLKSVYRQKSVWFNPFFEFINYSKKIYLSYDFISKFELIFLTLQAYATLVIWLLHSIILSGGLIISLFAGKFYVCIWFFAFCFYWLIPALYLTKIRKKISNGGNNSYTSIILGSLYVLTHSIGPIWGVCRWLKALILKTPIEKPQTENS